MDFEDVPNARPKLCSTRAMILSLGVRIPKKSSQMCYASQNESGSVDS